MTDQTLRLHWICPRLLWYTFKIIHIKSNAVLTGTRAVILIIRVRMLQAFAFFPRLSNMKPYKFDSYYVYAFFGLFYF